MTSLKKLKIKIKVTLPTAFFLLIFLVSTILIVLNQVSYAGSMSRLSSDIMEEINNEISHELQVLKEKSHSQLMQAVFFLERSSFEEMLDSEDSLATSNMSPVLLYMFQNNPVIVQCYYGNEKGDFYLIHRNEQSGYSLKIKYFEKNVSHTILFDSTGTFVSEEDGSDYLKYDPRQRPWYASGLSTDGIFNSNEIYKFYRTGQMGFTYSKSVVRNGGVTGVAGLDISVDSLSSYFTTIDMNEGSFLFLLDKNGRGIAHSQSNAYSESCDSILHEPTRIVVDQYRNSGFDDKVQKRRLAGEKYFTLFTEFPSGSVMGIAVPASSILGDVYRTNFALVLFSIAGVLLASLAGIYISHRVTGPLELLQRQTEEIRNFKLNTDKRIVSRFLEIDQIGESFQRMQKGLASFRKFVPSDLVRQIVNSGTEAALGGEERNMTIMFMDIAGFTTLSEQLDSDALVRFISDFFQEMSEIIIQHGGTVDKYIGDCIMAFWNAPKTIDNHEKFACEAALACQVRLEQLQDTWRERGLPEISIRVGIHSDNVTVGNMGSKERLNYTVIGDGVNLASRLEGLGKIYGVPLIISECVAGRLPETFHLRPLDCVVVKGKSAPVPIYTIDKEQCKSVADLHRCAYDHYVAQEWDEAQDSFTKILERDPDDTPAALFLARIAALKTNPPGKEWDGVFYNDHK